MDVWPPPPTNNADPPPGDAPPRRRLVTRFVWLDVVLGVLAGLVSWLLVVTIILICKSLLLDTYALVPVAKTLDWASLAIVALLYGFVWRVRPYFGGGALAFALLVLLPYIIYIVHLPDAAY